MDLLNAIRLKKGEINSKIILTKKGYPKTSVMDIAQTTSGF